MSRSLNAMSVAEGKYMSVSKNEYGKMTKKASPGSPLLKNCIRAFFIGGLICCFAEGITLLFEKYTKMTADEVNALVLIILIGITAILTGLGVFDKIAEFAGAGTFVPITGFANSIVSPAMEHQKEGRILGTGAQMFKLAGPVIVYGTCAAIIYGIIVYIFELY